MLPTSTDTNGFSERLLMLWSIRATVVFPVPVSPCIIIEKSVKATCLICSNTFFIPLLLPRRLSRELSIAASKTLKLLESLLFSIALLMIFVSVSRSGGLTMKSYAPILMAFTASETSACAVIIITGRSLSRLFSARRVSSPSIFGMSISSNTTEGLSFEYISRACTPSHASIVVQPLDSMRVFMMTLIFRSSSTISMGSGDGLMSFPVSCKIIDRYAPS